MTTKCRASREYLAAVLACQNLGTLLYLEPLFLVRCAGGLTWLVSHCGDTDIPGRERLRLDGSDHGYVLVNFTLERHILLRVLLARGNLYLLFERVVVGGLNRNYVERHLLERNLVWSM